MKILTSQIAAATRMTMATMADEIRSHRVDILRESSDQPN